MFGYAGGYYEVLEHYFRTGYFAWVEVVLARLQNLEPKPAQPGQPMPKHLTTTRISLAARTALLALGLGAVHRRRTA